MVPEAMGGLVAGTLRANATIVRFHPAVTLFGPSGKPAGMPCVQLMDDYRCALFDRPERPAVCTNLRPSAAMCAHDRTAALAMLDALEQAMRPD
jgi:hypothetical protein